MGSEREAVRSGHEAVGVASCGAARPFREHISSNADIPPKSMEKEAVRMEKQAVRIGEQAASIGY